MTYPEDFKTFWNTYPPRWNAKAGKWKRNCKRQAFAEWLKLTDEEKELATELAGEVEWSAYTWDARRWLLHRRWEDETVDAPPPIDEVKQSNMESFAARDKRETKEAQEKGMAEARALVKGKI